MSETNRIGWPEEEVVPEVTAGRAQEPLKAGGGRGTVIRRIAKQLARERAAKENIGVEVVHLIEGNRPPVTNARDGVVPAKTPKEKEANEAEERIAKAVEERIAPRLKKIEEAVSAQRPAYLTIRSAARLASLSYDHVRRAVESRELPAGDVGNGGRPLYRITPADFDRWMQKNKGGKELPPRSELKEKVSRYLPGVD
jgi:excisionase family DNA binding protein